MATQCIADAFKVDPTDSAAMSAALGGQSLVAIYGVFEKMKARTPPPAATTSKPASTGPSEEDKATAELLKGQGNTAMAQKDYPTAIDLYTQALALVPNNSIYLSNRAAAFSAQKDYDKAIADAQVAVDTDPTYTKAWSRLGHARFAKGDSRGAMEAYKAGLDAEGANKSDIMKRGYETAKKRVEDEEAITGGSGPGTPRDRAGSPGAGGGGMPDLAGLASMLGGMGGAGRGGAGGAGGGSGMPDLSSIMQNPMFAQMAQNVMSNPGLMQGMMNNPRMREMMDSVGGGGGGGMPDFGSLMSDPGLAEM